MRSADFIPADSFNQTLAWSGVRLAVDNEVDSDRTLLDIVMQWESKHYHQA